MAATCSLSQNASLVWGRLQISMTVLSFDYICYWATHSGIQKLSQLIALSLCGVGDPSRPLACKAYEPSPWPQCHNS